MLYIFDTRLWSRWHNNGKDISPISPISPPKHPRPHYQPAALPPPLNPPKTLPAPLNPPIQPLPPSQTKSIPYLDNRLLLYRDDSTIKIVMMGV